MVRRRIVGRSKDGFKSSIEHNRTASVKSLPKRLREEGDGESGLGDGVREILIGRAPIAGPALFIYGSPLSWRICFTLRRARP